MKFIKGDVVQILAEFPDGLDKPSVLGNVGIVRRVERDNDVLNISVLDEDGNFYVYGEDQLKFAPDEEIMEAFVKVMNKYVSSEV